MKRSLRQDDNQINLQTLPTEILINILLKSDYEQIVKICQQSKRLRNICDDRYFWQNKAQRDFGQKLPKEINNPKIGYLKLLTVEGKRCEIGSERFWDASQCLLNATIRGKLNLVTYFTSRISDPIWIIKAMFSAVRFRHVDIIEFFTNRIQRFHPDLYNFLLNSALHGASAGNHLDLVHHYLNLGANDINGAVNAAATYGSLDVLRELYKDGSIDLEKTFVTAAGTGNINILEYLISNWDNMININSIQNALEEAVTEDRLAAVKLLYSRYFIRISLDFIDELFLDAAGYASVPMLEYLKENNNINDPELLNKALYDAAFNDNFNNVVYLLQNGANDISGAIDAITELYPNADTQTLHYLLGPPL